ncbi:MAG TPA: hypothetical protein VNM37_19060, partial [Candidatus Dormibacteraeota bacterium]|nr:hypothetical protein [Candidatus Dormibacteraeota bacterium]
VVFLQVFQELIVLLLPLLLRAQNREVESEDDEENRKILHEPRHLLLAIAGGLAHGQQCKYRIRRVPNHRTSQLSRSI